MAVVLAGVVPCGVAQVVISEFMAKNDKTLADGNGTYSDWIELYNTGTNSVDLTGWYLSDDADDLTQWEFPSGSIAADGFLVVFASGQDTTNYVDSLDYLHTTFKLSAGGESVLLTKADGVTIAASFLDYPDQSDDISYGLDQDSGASYLIAEQADATALLGTSTPSTSWNTAGFDDSGWDSGTTAVGFDDYLPSTYSNIGLDVGDMHTKTALVYIRVPFDVDEDANFSQLSLRMKYDDGFVAYINGTQVASANASASSTQTDVSHAGTDYEDFTLLNADAYLTSGANVLAIRGLNTDSGSQDLYMMPVLNGISVGSIDTNTAMYLTTPTPGADNVAGVLGYVGDTSFSVDRGFFTNAFDVAISCKTDSAEIYYTTDATEPSEDNGTLYTNAISISKTTVLRAVATKSGYQSSDVDTQTYLFLDDIIAQGTSVSSLDPAFPSTSVNGQRFDYGMDTDITQSSTYSGEIEGALKAIPSISIVTDPDNLFDASTGIYVNADEDNDEENGEDWERETSIELINPDGTDGFQINGGIRIRGASSTTSSNPKHSFRFFFRSEYGTSHLNYPLFGDDGVDSFKRMDLRTGQNFSWAYQTPAYATWLYDIFTRDTHRDMNQPYTRGEYYHLYINGMYWGLYQTEERCNADYAESYYGDDDDDFDAVKSDADTGEMYAVDGTRTAYDTLWTNINSGVSANAAYFEIQGMNDDGTENSSYTKLLDVDNVIDYMLLVYFTANRDSPIGPPAGIDAASMPRNLNVIYNRNNPDGFKFVAHDNEHSLEIIEGVNHNRFNQSLSTAFDAQNFFTPWWLHLKLMNNAEYALRFADHVHEYFFNGGALTATETTARLEARKSEIYASVVAESARWGDSTGTLYKRDENWLVQANWLLNTYMSQRTDIVYSQIVAKGWYPTVAAPVFNQHGGSIASGFALTLSGSGTIYYTTDGSDPRQVGGIAVGTKYGSAITLTHSAQVKARVLSGGVWSALTKATFVLDEDSPLRVTELMYHPADTGAEFIELLNTSTQTVGLAGTEFTDGIQFDFIDGDTAMLAPGAYVVLVNDYDTFTNQYSNWTNINIAGQYYGKFFIPTGALDNSGETITLMDGLGQTIQSFAYEDWYDLTDGEGYSLTLIDPTAATNTWSDSTSWRASAVDGGTPGEGDSDFPSPGDLVINEALTHQDADNPGDWIELYNSSTNTLDINGWFLSDDEDDLAMVTLTNLAKIAPGGYLVLTEASHFGITNTAAGTNGFALSELGESIYLSSGEDGELTGYRVEQAFGAAERDVTFGRYTTSDGNVDFPAQSSQTSGAANETPLIGDVVFTEILYHPADSNAFEYIELCNRTAADVPLYDSSYPTNTWKLEGAVEFTFPQGLVLSPGECLLITETPAAAFTNYYTVPDGVIVLGPYDGQLDNSGEELKLTRPGNPEADTGEVPYILVELVNYDDESPWPVAADGLGSSLARVAVSLYANDSANWSAAATLSPGSTDVEIIDSDSDEDGMLDSWEMAYFESTNAVNGGADDDWDGDGTSNYAEYIAGTDPTDVDSLFEITDIDAGSACVFSWTSTTGKIYSLWFCTNLVSSVFTCTNSAIAATPPLNTTTVTVDGVAGVFYQVRVENE